MSQEKWDTDMRRTRVLPRWPSAQRRFRDSFYSRLLADINEGHSWLRAFTFPSWAMTRPKKRCTKFRDGLETQHRGCVCARVHVHACVYTQKDAYPSGQLTLRASVEVWCSLLVTVNLCALDGSNMLVSSWLLWFFSPSENIGGSRSLHYINVSH